MLLAEFATTRYGNAEIITSSSDGDLEHASHRLHAAERAESEFRESGADGREAGALSARFI